MPINTLKVVKALAKSYLYHNVYQAFITGQTKLI